MKNKKSGWLATGIGIVAIVAMPILVIVGFLFQPTSDTWEHIKNTVLLDYIWNSTALIIGVGFLTMILGVSTAWLTSAFEFRGRKWLEWGLVLPLAMPSYIVAYTYVGILDYTGVVQAFTRNTLQLRTDFFVPFDITSLPGAIFVLSMVLYPYTYLITRAVFLNQSQSLLEASQVLGKSLTATFFKIALPVARPAIVAGTSLVLMEVLNDYGAVKYYGIPTFTTGIFRAWFSFGDLPSAVRLSAILVLLVFGLILLERWQRGNKRFGTTSSRTKPLSRKSLSTSAAIGAFVVCLIPFLFGFFIPALQLFAWTVQTFPSNLNPAFWQTLGNTVQSALIAASVCVSIALLLGFMMRLNQSKKLWAITRIATIGYAIPGAVIAVGVIIPFTWIDKNVFGQLFLTGSIMALIYAYVVRFLAVGYNAVESGFEKINPSLKQAAQLLGASNLKVLRTIHIPLLRNSLLAGFLLVFVDILKELPLTLILRPFNFDTLATKAYDLASDELLQQSAIYAIVIIVIGIVPIFLLNKLLK